MTNKALFTVKVEAKRGETVNLNFTNKRQAQRAIYRIERMDHVKRAYLENEYGYRIETEESAVKTIQTFSN